MDAPKVEHILHRHWRAVVDGEEVFEVTGPDAERLVRAVNGAVVSYCDSVRPTPENGYAMRGPWIDVE